METKCMEITMIAPVYLSLFVSVKHLPKLCYALVRIFFTIGSDFNSLSVITGIHLDDIN